MRRGIARATVTIAHVIATIAHVIATTAHATASIAHVIATTAHATAITHVRAIAIIKFQIGSSYLNNRACIDEGNVISASSQ